MSKSKMSQKMLIQNLPYLETFLTGSLKSETVKWRHEVKWEFNRRKRSQFGEDDTSRLKFLKYDENSFSLQPPRPHPPKNEKVVE
jgi:hypothetical protein